MCIGCRQRTEAAELLRIVVDLAARPEPDLSTSSVLPDPRRSARGRGAWLHPVTRCVELAERRRAFGRALRVESRLDLTAVREYVESVTGAGSR
ncbi:YlxR family protein [Jatrophihabitans lederbergiae]|uniref:YlxR family protein n=1 Tax=Jatrophihabitans lederbergiae TaxID=3075547 RepID=UPI0037C12C0B